MVKKIYEFSDTHKQVIKEHNNYKINCLQGAVRSGKTYLTNILFLNKLENKKGNVIISGYSSNSVKKNVVSDWEEILGIEIKFHNNSKGEYFDIELPEFSQITFYVAGAGKSGDEKKVQGMTVLGWLADEAATYSESFFQMMLTRLSLENSFSFFTLNPDSPSHWLKEWLDKNGDPNSPDYINGFVKNYTFVLDDNYSLPENYKKQIKNSLSGHLYDRLVLGKWAIGEGTVYSIDYLITKTQMEIDRDLKGKLVETIKIGVDLGTSHPSSFIVSKKVNGIWYIIEEYYKAKISPSNLSIELKKLKDKYQNADIYYDHAAKWFFQQMKDDFPNIKLNKAKKDVSKGIAHIESLILNGKLIISKSCINLIKELNGYSWDPKKNGEVIKEKDDACDALRYAIYSFEYSSSYY